MADRTDYSRYELIYGRDGKTVELCTGGGPEETGKEDIAVTTVESSGWRLAVTADRSAKFIFGVTLEGGPEIIRQKPQVQIADDCTMVMARLFEECDEDESLRVYSDSGILYIVIGDGEPYRIRYQTWDPLLKYTFQYDEDKRLRCIQLAIDPEQ